MIRSTFRKLASPLHGIRSFARKLASRSSPSSETAVESSLRETAVEIDSWKHDLNEALKKGNWEGIDRVIREHQSEAFEVRLNENEDTVLLSAFKGGKKGLLLTNSLVDMIPMPDLLTKTDKYGNTALHLAAKVGSVEHARKLVVKNPDLLYISNGDGLLPIQLALDRDHLADAHRMTSYLLGVMKDQDAAVAWVMQSLVKAGFYEMAFKLVEQNPKLMRWGFNLLEQMASDPGGFPSTGRPLGWKSLIYSLAYIYDTTDQTRMTEIPCAVLLWNVIAKVLLVIGVGDIPELKLKHHYALQLLKSLCSKLISTSEYSMLSQPFLLAAQNGIEEIVKEILDHHAAAINFTDEDGRSVFHVAVMYRHENILKIAHDKNMELKGTYVEKLDKNGNNILHMVGNKPRQAGIDTDSGAVFQMQSELQWFKKVTKLVTPQEYILENKAKKKPFTLFEEEHADMATKEKEWMSGMATASSVAASLVATVAFAATFQVPGGNNTNGIPNFSNETSFRVFAITDALALFSSITSVLSFLSVFTSRYGLNDYHRALPHRVIIGLISLLFSFIFLNIAFSSTLYLVFANKNIVTLVPIIILSSIPVILYANLQLPSLIAMIKSTVCPSILRPW